jgi:hypothetical protein
LYWAFEWVEPASDADQPIPFFLVSGLRTRIKAGILRIGIKASISSTVSMQSHHEKPHWIGKQQGPPIASLIAEDKPSMVDG